MIASSPIHRSHRGRLSGASIGASIAVAACEAVGIQPDKPGVRLSYFAFVGDPPADAEGWPDVEFEVVETKPEWW